MCQRGKRKYIADRLGRVYSVNKKYYKILRPHIDRGGYWAFWDSNRGKWITWSRFVWQYFNGKIYKNMEINHIDGHKNNNSIDNLELVTRSQNQKHAYDTGLQIAACGENCGASKLTELQVKRIRYLSQHGYSQNELARAFNLTQANIWVIIHRKTWKHI